MISDSIQRALGTAPPCGVVGVIVVACFVQFSGCRKESSPAEPHKKAEGNAKQMEQTADRVRRRYVETTGENISESRKAFVADLKRRYGGIDASVTKPPESVEQLRRFAQLMREWNPLQFSADDLRDIAGEPTKEVSWTAEGRPPNSMKSMTYWFYGSGIAGAGWEFTIDGGTIVAVRYLMGQ